MAKPTTRTLFKEYCLRKLGSDVIEINVSDEQVEDRIDEAISFWRDYHYDGSELTYIKHQLTVNDIANGYIETTDAVIGVVRIFEMGSMMGMGSGMFNAQYQFMLNNVTAMNSGGLSDYFIMRTNLSLMEEILVGKPIIRFNRHANRVDLDVSASKLVVGNYIIIEAYTTIETPSIWSDRWLQNYATVLIKEQWGGNLTKFSGVQLIGGMTFNGEQILNDAQRERAKLEEDVIVGFSPLIRNFYG